MWEFVLKWLLIFSGILGGTCLLAGILMGFGLSVKNIFGSSNDQFPETGILPAYILSGGVFSLGGGVLWLILALFSSGTGTTSGEIALINALSINGILGLLYIGIGGENAITGSPGRGSSLATRLIACANVGMFLGGMLLINYADKVIDLSLGVFIGEVVGGFAGGLIGGLICGNDRIFSRIISDSGKEYSVFDNITSSVLYGWLVGTIVGIILSGWINATIVFGLTGLVGLPWAPIAGLCFAVTICLFFAPFIVTLGGLVGLPVALGVFQGIIGTQRIAKRIARRISWIITPILSFLNFRTVICGGCLQFTNPMRSVYENGIRYCEHCNHEIEYTKDPGEVLLTFGSFSDMQLQNMKSGSRSFLRVNPDFERIKYPIEVSKVYLETKTCDRRVLERFVTYIVNYPPKHGVRSVQIFYRGNLDDLEENLKNALHNTFVQVQQMG